MCDTDSLDFVVVVPRVIFVRVILNVNHAFLFLLILSCIFLLWTMNDSDKNVCISFGLQHEDNPI